MITSIVLCLVIGVLCALDGWALHRNFKPHTDPTDWECYYPFKPTDSFALTIAKGMSGGCLLAAVVAGCSWLVGWSLGCNGWTLAMWMLLDFTFCLLVMEGRLIFFRLRWWCYYLTPGARTALSQMWQRDGYSAF